MDTWSILLVDDEPTQLLIMARLLKRAGYNVSTAADGHEALLKFDAGDFPLMITEWDMPVMSGLALCEAIRARTDKPYIYTILLTARDAIEHVVTGLQSGADDYLTKPVIEPELIARLNTGKRIVTLERSLRTASEANQRLAYAHPLTGVYNRAFLMWQLPRDIDAAQRAQTSLSMILCDADYLKSVNDRYGHDAGGRTLIAIAQLLDVHARALGGWLAHHGGDEFSIALLGKGVPEAADIAEQLRALLATEIVMLAGIAVTITASFGVTGWKRVPRYATAEQLLATADECMYESKKAGRDRVTARVLR